MSPLVCEKLPPVENTRISVVGFTLIELLTTLTVAAILLALAVPAYERFTGSNRLAAATNDFVADLGFARLEAMKRSGGNDPNPLIRGQVIICGSSDGATCNAATWTSGWIVFWDAQGDGGFTAGTDTLLKTHAALPNSVTTTPNPAGTVLLVISPVGTFSNIANNTSLRITDAKLNQSRLVCFLTTGRTLVRENLTVCT